MDEPSVKPLSKRRTLAFKIILIIFPLVLLVLLEIGLRIFKYGYNTDLFIESSANSAYWVMNPAASKKFFLHQANATTGNIEPFRKKKEPGTLRIFVLGESTTIGYPYFHNGSFHRWLEYRLQREMPDRPVEIVNLSLTAVNSYTILDFAKQLMPYQPDVVMIYCGQNEYYGALGAGSTEQFGSNGFFTRMTLALRPLKVFQLFNSLVSPRDEESRHQKETMMQRMVGDQQIAYASPVYQAGIDQFYENMDKTLDFFHRHGVPVLLSNLVCNEKDYPPFGGDDAKRNFLLAQTSLKNGAIETASQYFTLARDLDKLRLRAPEKINEIIEDLSKKYDNTTLVDVKTAFEKRSPNGIIGKELMLEHVHPNLGGYALMADIFYKGLRERNLIRVRPDDELSFDSLWAEMPVEPIDSLSAKLRVQSLTAHWPFTGSSNARLPADSAVSPRDRELAQAIFDKQMSWLRAMEVLYDQDIAARDYNAARRVAEALVLEYPLETAYYDKAAMLNGQTHREDRALYYFKRSFALVPTFEKARYIFVLSLKLGRRSSIIPYIDYAIANNSSGIDLRPMRDSILRLIHPKNPL